MSAYKPDDVIIHGITSNGKVFRPSDWAERLCGILSSFDKGNRLSYHHWVQPILVDKVRCVLVDSQLENINPSMFRFLMDFASDNDLQVKKANDFETHLQADFNGNDNDVADLGKTPYAEGVLREIPPEETASAFMALSLLRPLLTDKDAFVAQVNGVQRAYGYRLLGIFEEGKTDAVAVCGFREEVNLMSGRHIHIDDVVTVPQSRKRGYAVRLLNAVEQIARESGITHLHIDSSVSGERTTAHRVYFQLGFDIEAYHFVCKVKEK